MLPTIDEHSAITMIYTPLRTPLLPGYCCSVEYLNCCPATPAPRRKMRISIDDDKEVLIPPNNDDSSSPTEELRIPLSDFPSLPFGKPDQSGESSMTAETSSSNKLHRSERTQSLAHLVQRQNSYGARCA